MDFKLDSSKLEKGIELFEDRVMIAVRMYGETAALKLEGYAKVHAPWKNRTGHARQRLKGVLERKSSTVYRIKLSHGVDYGPWLELANNKKYAIIQPTIDLKSQEVFNGLDRLFDKMR
jgi:hypothetical protein